MTFDVYEFFVSKNRQCFKDSPNVLALFKMLSVPIQDRVDVYEYLLSMTSIDDKTGTLLDQIGSKIGVKRPPEQVREDHIFTLYDDNEVGDWWDDYTGFSEEDEPELGGYFIDENGLDTGDGQYMNDADYRVLLKQKAAIIRAKMTDDKLIEYFLIFGAPVEIDEGVLVVKAIPNNGADLTTWERWYIENRGFKPAGIRVYIDDTIGATPL